MKITILIFLICLSTLNVLSQKETFDLVTFNPPKAWKKEINQNNYVLFTFTSQNNYCQIYVMQSTDSKGSLDADFESEWQTFVVKSYNPSTDPQMTEVSEEDGWKAKAGVASFNFNNSESYAILTTMTGFGKVVSILALTNNQEYMPKIEEFLASVSLTKPLQNNQVKQNVNKSTASSKYAFTTTNFDDGWTATEQINGVEVSKGNVKVLIHFGVEYTDYTRNLGDNQMIEHFWNLLLTPRYKVNNISVSPTDVYDRTYFGEAVATESATGKKVYLSLMIDSENGFAKCIEIVTTDKAALSQAFPNYNKMKEMRNYNKFAVSPKDLPGIWENSSGAFAQYYYSNTGNYAGMGGVQTYSKFTLKADNTYQYEYIGGSGMMGNQQIHTKNTSGKFSANNWEFITVEKNGEKTEYNARFEVVRGGRILHLVNKKYSGLAYHLTKQN